MRELGKVVVQIPARGGSKRVKSKNLRFLGPKPLLSYAIENAKSLDYKDIYVNSDSDSMLKLAQKYGVKEYKRNSFLASDEATGDDFTYDFIKNIKSDTCIMISPACPFLDQEDIKGAISAYRASKCDTLISCEEIKMQAFFKNIPININDTEALRPTQENTPINILNWAITIWDSKKFISNYETYGFAYLGKNRILHKVPTEHALKISTEDDFKLAEKIILKTNSNEIHYWNE